jgi:hypothetical protein
MFVMPEIIKATPKQILKEKRPSSKDYQRNENKKWREAYSAAKICMFYNLEGQITVPANEPADGLIEIGNSKFYFQQAECKNPGPRGKPDDIFHEVNEDDTTILYLDISPICPFNRIKEIVLKKESHYSNADKKDLILAVYCNLLHADEGALKIPYLRKELLNSKFSDIIVHGHFGEVAENKCFFIKEGAFYNFCQKSTATALQIPPPLPNGLDLE